MPPTAKKAVVAKPNPKKAGVTRLQQLRNTQNRSTTQNAEMLDLMYDLLIKP